MRRIVLLTSILISVVNLHAKLSPEHFANPTDIRNLEAERNLNRNLKANLAVSYTETDSLALLALYDSTRGTDWMTSWDLDQPMSTWHGLELQDGRVTGLNLAENNLTGSLPSQIGDLTQLTHLILTSNNLSGEIPSELGNLANLTNLDLTANQLSGSIPSALSTMTNLIALWLHTNSLEGNIPADLSKLSTLKIMDLHKNKLVGNIPSELGQLSNLIHLTLDQNMLSGSIPAELGELTNLTILNLCCNNLTDSIPGELGNLTKLSGLILYGNKFEGNIPVEFGELTNLRELWINSNPHLKGPVPVNITSLQLLNLFYFNGTNLCELENDEYQAWRLNIDQYAGTDRICSSGTEIITFGFAGIKDSLVQYDSANHSITIEVNKETDLSTLVSIFELSDGASVKIGSTDQVSGITINDFTDPVTYSITAEDDTISQDWTITVLNTRNVGILNTTRLVNIYPNPANETLIISTVSPGYFNIELISLQGNLIYSNFSEGQTHYIDLSSFRNGIYYLTIRSGDFMRTEKIIKLSKTR